MQNSSDPGIRALDGGTLVPVLTADDIRPGSLLTGIAYQSVRRVVNIEDDTVYLLKLPETPPEAGHRHRFTRHSDHSECSCGLMRKPLADILPSDPGIARTYRLDSVAPLLVPDRFTIYQLPTGNGLVTVSPTGSWNGTTTQLPIITKLHPVWSVPAALRELLA